MGILRLATGAVQTASKVCAVVSGLLVIALMFLTAADVIARTILGGSIRGAFEFAEVALATSVALAIPYTMQISSHVAADSITARLPKRSGAYVATGGLLAALPVLIWWAVATIGSASHAISTGRTRSGLADVPLWPGYVAIAIGISLLCLEVLIQAVKTVQDSRTRQVAD
jgi:TRAP-type C4-dicarboxylate transport system permease small subunit